MISNSPIIPSPAKLTKSNSNFNHIHILCPYKFCSCFCTICNSSFSICSCICHSNNKKTRLNNLSMSNDNNNKNKTILSNYSTNMYQKTKKYLHYNSDISLSQSNDIKRDLSSNHDNFSKKIFYDKLYKHIGNYNGRSLSEINIKRNIAENIRKPSLYRKENYINKSHMNNFYTNSESTYNYNYDNKKLLLYGNPLTERDNSSYRKYLNKDNNNNKEEVNQTNDKFDEKINKYFNINYENDIDNVDNVNNNEKTYDNKLEKSNYQYLNNYFRKKCKNKSSLNSPQKAKIKEIIIQSKINKNQYTTYVPKNNISRDEKAHLMKNKNKKVDINDENKDTSNKNNKTYEVNKLLYNNYLNKKDKINNDKQINRNRNRLNILNKKKNKTSYVKLSNNLNNLRKNLNINISKIKKVNYIKESKKDKLTLSTFSFSYINDINNENIIEKLKNELFQKNKEILDYKGKFIELKNEIEFYKKEIFQLKQKDNDYINNNINQEENNFNYGRKNFDDMNNLNSNYNFVNQENNLNYINKDERQIGLSSKLNIGTDLNIDNNYYLSFCQNQIISDKCIFAISPLTKSKSILCFDYKQKSFTFKDYADFGDFQENYSKSMENIQENQNTKSIFLTINYNFYIVTGENCDLFYVFNALDRTINKLCSLKNNHSNGAMLDYNGSIVCIGGNYNKKVELYNQAKNEWIDLPELQTERCNFASVLYKNKYIFCLFGYNLPTKQNLSSIEYLDIENYNKSSWRYLKYKNENLLSLYLNFSFAINFNDKKIIIVGGNDDQENVPNEYFYQLIISNNFEVNKDSYIEKTTRKLKDINKNKCYLFNKGHHIFFDNKNIFYMAFDNDLRVHLFNANNMAHDVFYLD